MSRRAPPESDLWQALTAEHHRLFENKNKAKDWNAWGPYLSERQWGTVREDYKPARPGTT